ncbi:MAG: hypothetical protein HXX08_17395 [Chloroflexi bacterium]|uniref:Uncharacterized protein n=1 Tax=Candidatus Chlorohelix allophototropha TaxID=3003348 RepID=A0A8T7M6M5_9CHLR|nr:hypothetical protein [Chloroflexota bacterium]WJW69544.1 hypothetical protein OZ401_003163 [Chloroflexota bacterium L227-S17]
MEIIIQLGTDLPSIDANTAGQLVHALSQFGYVPTINVIVTAKEGHDFEMLQTILTSNKIDWKVVPQKLKVPELVLA